MDGYCNSLHWKRSVVGSPSSGKESPLFGLTPVSAGDDFQFGPDNSFSSPFDWNDDKLRDLIDGDNGDSGDHVVPYPFQSERNVPSVEGDFIINQYDAKASNVKPVDRKKTSDLHNIKHAANEALPSSEFVVDSWPNLSVSNTTKPDQDLSCALESDNAAGTLDGTGELDSDSAFFQKLDVNIANMGILDDLDKILSNDNPDFCLTSLPSTQKLGLASKDVTTIPEKSIPLLIDPPFVGFRALRSISDKSESKDEYMLLQNQHSTRGGENLNDFITPNISQAFHEPFIKEKIALETGGKAPAFSMELDSGFAVMPDSSLDEVFLDNHPKSKEHKANQLRDLFRYRPMSFDKHNNHYISMNQPCPSVVLPQPVQPHYNSKSTPYTSIAPHPMQPHYNIGSMPYPGPELTSSISMDFASQYSMPGLSHFRDEQVYHQSVPCSSYVSPPYHSNSSKITSDRPIGGGFAMTPKKKIEKLRKQQQMRAMLANQKLQQQFCDQVVSTDNNSEIARGDFFVEGKSHLEQNDSNIVSSAVDDHPEEESILYQLQEIILKLDTRTKVNIRDSFIRLAQNARVRQYANNTSGINTSIVNKEDINSKVENESNQIDRAVAHLLFHQPSEVLKKPTEIPESQLSEEFYYESKPSSSLSFAR